MGGFQTGGLPDLDLSVFFCPFESFLVLSRFFRDFPDLLGDGPGIFPIRPFALSRPIQSTYEEQSRKGPRHNLDLSWKKWETPPGLETPRFSFSQYHAPQKHYLPDKMLPELFLKLPLPDFSFSELISENYPIPSVFVWVAWHYPPKILVIVELLVFTVTRFEMFRINWVIFSWQMVKALSAIKRALGSCGLGPGASNCQRFGVSLRI